MMALSIALAVVWARWSSGRPCWERIGRRGLWILPVAGVMLAFNFAALTAAIPWKGDEDYHILRTLDFADFIMKGLTPKLAIVGMFGLALLGRRTKRVTLLLVAASAILGIGIIVGLQLERVFPGGIHRYPFFSRPFSAAPVIALSPIFDRHPPEWVFRIVPFVATVLIACYPALRQRATPAWMKVALPLTIATIPLFWYYTSLLYLELPAVLLMIVVCFSAPQLLTRPASEVPRLPAWYALIVIGFIKETLVPFLGAFVLCRYIVQLPAILRAPKKLSGLWAEARLDFCLVVPLLLFLAYRSLWTATRPVHPTATNLLDWKVYWITASAHARQFGPILLLFVAGLILMLRRGDWLSAAFFVMAIAGHNAMHIADSKGYVGYGRFTLLAAPMIFVPACYAIDSLLRRSPGATAGLLAVVLAANVWLCPMYWDGSRKRGWGDSPRSTTEWSYPYREAIRWINEHHANEFVRYTGMTYQYFVQYYAAAKLPDNAVNVTPARGTEVRRWEQALGKASSEGINVVLYHVVGEDVPTTTKMYGFTIEKQFENAAGNKLVLLVRRPGATKSTERSTP